MISYNWGDQPVVKKIASSLKSNGYLVWLDIEQMKGSLLEASMDKTRKSTKCTYAFSVSRAVENAALVLVCMSQKYQDSPNCRLEGEYTAARRVNFVPLLMQKDFIPRGWYNS